MKGWRTIVFNVLSAGVAILETTEVINVLPEKWTPVAMAGIAAANVVLRMLTTTPVGEK